MSQKTPKLTGAYLSRFMDCGPVPYFPVSTNASSTRSSMNVCAFVDTVSFLNYFLPYSLLGEFIFLL
jgi:hypothetical protein